MVENSTPGCWSQCLWSISTCHGRRVLRVGPSDPIPVVSLSGQKNKDQLRSRGVILSEPSSQIPKVESQNGIVNQFYVPDENGDIPDTATGSHAAEGGSHGRAAKCIDNELKNSVFIEIDKDRRLRVVHLSAKDDSQDQEDSADEEQVVSTSNLPKKSIEEEDEYWFSKWTRKPRFRSIFEKNTIHCSTEDTELENNNSVNSGTLSKDFELARAAAAAKRRAWAYNNGSSEPVVQQSTVVDNDEEEFNSIVDICDTSQKWSKKGGRSADTSATSDSPGEAKISPSPHRNSPKPGNISEGAEGVTNLGFENDDEKENEDDTPAELPVNCTQASMPMSSPSPSNSTSTNVNETEDEVTNITDGREDDMQPQSRKTTPILFFIHGISGSSEIWKHQMEYFHNLGYEIVVPDLLGHGFSSTPNNVKYYLFESLAQDLLSVFDYFVEEDKKVVLIGHGYGASLASVITRVRPKSCVVLISVSGGGPTPLVSRSCCRGSLIPFYCKIFHKNTRKGRFDDPEVKHVLPSLIHEHILNGQIWNDGDSAFYRRITVPTLLVYGMKDKVVNLVEECEMERTIPKSFLEVIDSAGHMVMIDEPTKLNKMLNKFIQSWV